MHILLDSKENTLHIQIHDLIPSILLINGVEVGSPSRPGVCKKDINMVRLFANLFDQTLNLSDLAAVRGN
jgi:hypothetical protein